MTFPSFIRRSGGPRLKRPMKRLALLSLALLAGCTIVSPEGKIRDKLVSAGVKPRMAECLAGKLAHNLSYSELKELDRVAKAARPENGHLKFGALAEALKTTNDPHIVDVVTTAGLGCAIGG